MLAVDAQNNDAQNNTTITEICLRFATWFSCAFPNISKIALLVLDLTGELHSEIRTLPSAVVALPQ